MKKIVYLTISLCFSISVLHAQHNFVVQNGTAAVFNSLSQAYNAAVDGDTIYLPGGEFSAPTNIAKSLTWIGVGHHPDSTAATYFTAIANALNFKGTCSNSYFTGIFFRQSLNFNDTEINASNVVFSRCRMDYGVTLKGTTDTVNIDFKFEECYIHTLSANYGSNITLEKCIVSGTINNFYQSYFNRNLFLLGRRSSTYGPRYVFNRTSNSLIQNSIFIQYHTTLNECDNNNLQNNLFAEAITLPQGTNMGVNNVISTGVDQFIVAENATVFAYENNYHLKADSPGKGLATDGSDVGLYGATDSIKDGFLPIVPHIQSINIDMETTNGMLPVKIIVEAQER